LLDQRFLAPCLETRVSRRIKEQGIAVKEGTDERARGKKQVGAMDMMAK
jgi:hypothetical protein